MGGGRVSIVVFDVDGVLTTVKNSWGYLHSYFNVVEEAERVKRLFESGEIDYLEWMRRDVELWIRASGGRLHKRVLVEALSRIPIRPEARPVFRALRRMGVRIALVSGGIDLLVARVARELGPDAWVANKLLFDREGYLIPGGVPLVGAYKEAAVKRIVYELGGRLEDTMFVGDSVWDSSAMRIVGYPVRYNDGGDLEGVAAFSIESLLELPGLVDSINRLASSPSSRQ